MLADLILPRGSISSLAAVVTLSEGFQRFVTEPLNLLGYCRWDGRSGHVATPDNHRNSLQVAPTRKTSLRAPDSDGASLPLCMSGWW